MKASHRSLGDWLSDIEEMASKVVAYTAETDFEQFMANEPVRDLVIKKLENMGEASRYIRKLHPGFQESVPEMPWRDLTEMRNRLTHGYFDYSPAVVWRIALDEAPAILAQIRRVIAEHAGPISG
ncbi:DUF86 domain-containing protein [uncultured Sphingomonas sp.]|uniref:HepT-like ribonuclease domain-containing protein n=1 Tax=uncultured Sphingomonas sp. TaxID=158754 RepID=UPI0035CC9F85